MRGRRKIGFNGGRKMKDEAQRRQKMRPLAVEIQNTPGGLPISEVRKLCRRGHYTIADLTFAYMIYEYEKICNGRTRTFIAMCEWQDCVAQLEKKGKLCT